MTKSITARSTAAAAVAALATVAQAAEEASTGAAEMNVSVSMIGMIVGGLAVMGIVIWVLIKFLNK